MIKVKVYAVAKNGFEYPANIFYVNHLDNAKPTYLSELRRRMKSSGKKFSKNNIATIFIQEL